MPSRPLSAAESAYAREVFGESLDCGRVVRVFQGRPGFGGLGNGDGQIVIALDNGFERAVEEGKAPLRLGLGVAHRRAHQ